MWFSCGNLLVIVILLSFYFCGIICVKYMGKCGILSEQNNDGNKSTNMELKLERLRVLCNAIQWSQSKLNNENLDSLPDFDLNHINTEEEMTNLLQRFRRSPSFLHFHRRSSSTSTRFLSTSSITTTRRPTSSSANHIRIFNHFRSGSSASTWSPQSTSTESRFRIFHRGSSKNNDFRLSSSTPTSSTRSHRVRGAIRNFFQHSTMSTSTGSSVSVSTKSPFRMFHGSSPVNNAESTPTPSSRSHRVRGAIRNFLRPSKSSPSIEDLSTLKDFSEKRRTPPSLIDTMRIIPRTNPVAINTTTATKTAKYVENKRGNKWVQTGKKYLPVAVRFAKRYYEKRKDNQMAGNNKNNRYNHLVYDNNDQNSDVYTSGMDDSSIRINEETSTVFYCHQEDFHSTLIDGTLNDEGIGKCKMFNRIVTCPIVIQCNVNEADDCCEDEDGTPFCCGRFVADESLPYTDYKKKKIPTGSPDTVAIINIVLVTITVTSLAAASLFFILWYLKK